MAFDRCGTRSRALWQSDDRFEKDYSSSLTTGCGGGFGVIDIGLGIVPKSAAL